MKLIYVVLLFFMSMGIKAQSFQNFEINSPYNDFFSDFIKVNNEYLIMASQWGINVDSVNYGKNRNLFLLIDSAGSNYVVNYLDTFGVDKLNMSLISYRDSIYTLGVENISSDTAMNFFLNIYNSNFSLVNHKSYPNIKKEKLQFFQNNYIKDSILTISGAYWKSTSLNYWPLIIQINLNSLDLVKVIYFNERFWINDYIDFYPDESTYVFTVSLFGNNNLGSANTIVRYDSNFQLIDTTNLGYELNGNANILPYKDSLYIISGKGIDFWNYDQFPTLTRELRLQVVDSNFRFVDAKSFSYNDSTNARAGYVQNIVQNNEGDYFAGAFLEDNYLHLHPEAGILIVKLDSNLNTIWQKHIPGNSNYSLARIMAADDGGVLFIVAKGPLTGYNADAALIKIGSNGEVTNITDLKFPNRKAIVSIYPNPTSQNLNISLVAKNQNIDEIRIYDLQFKEILNRKINSTQTTIDVSKFAKGVYLVEGKTNTGEVFREKFVVE